MKTFFKYFAALIALLLVMVCITTGWYIYTRQPDRNGKFEISRLKDQVTIQYDERGVPHIRAKNALDMYRALGYVHAQERLFQMEIMRRLARGELAEIMGSDLVEVDRLFRTLGIAKHAEKTVEAMDMKSPAAQALQAYLDGVNQYQDTHKPPMEFNLLRIPKRPFTPQDSMAVTGYLAYSFAAAFKTEPVMTFIRDKLGPPYLRAFETEWNPLGVLKPPVDTSAANPAPWQPDSRLTDSDWASLAHLASASRRALELAAPPLFHGSNAWAISGKRTVSGKPLLAGDPHIAYSIPSVWFEAHTSYPGFELYGHYQALLPFAMLGHNTEFGWSITMFENDDIDLIAEKTNPDNANQVQIRDQWADLETDTQTIRVKDGSPVILKTRVSPHGPIITDAFKETFGRTPIAMWWAFLQTENPILDAFYELNRADTRDKAREAAEKIHAPGLNIVWANAEGDIAWWAAAKLPQRPSGVNPMFILDSAKGEAEKPGYFNFSFNPHEENPPRGYVVSANQQPKSSLPVPGYYLLPDRIERLNSQLSSPKIRWDTAASQALQLDVCNGYPNRIMQEIMPVLEAVVTDANDKAFLEPLQKWDSCYTKDSIAASLFSQFSYELAKAAFADELGDVLFKNLLGTPALDHALPLLVADANSPWWDNVNTPAIENQYETVRIAWTNTLKHMQGLYGTSLLDWSWARTHTLEQQHPMGKQFPFNYLFNVGPYHVPGGRETPNNFSGDVGPAPWSVRYGPSTRRVIDFGRPERSTGINPAGQSGVPFNSHYDDQAAKFVAGIYVRQRMGKSDIDANTESTLILTPAH